MWRAIALCALIVGARFHAAKAAYNLPAGVKEQLGLTQVKETFTCEKERNGYFADQDNDCKIFHICTDGRQATLACGLEQRFDQSKLTCNHADAAIPCDASEDFFYLNEKIGDKDAVFLGPSDIDKAKNARPDVAAGRAARA